MVGWVGGFDGLGQGVVDVFLDICFFFFFYDFYDYFDSYINLNLFQVFLFLFVLVRLLFYIDKDVFVDVCWVLFYLFDGFNEKI